MSRNITNNIKAPNNIKALFLLTQISRFVYDKKTLKDKLLDSGEVTIILTKGFEIIDWSIVTKELELCRRRLHMDQRKKPDERSLLKLYNKYFSCTNICSRESADTNEEISSRLQTVISESMAKGKMIDTNVCSFLKDILPSN
jgi:hypothetical protein